MGNDLGLPRQKVSYHLRALEELGLVEHVEDLRRGNCTERVVQATASHYLVDSSLLGGLEATPRDTADRLPSDYLAAVSARTITELGELRERAAETGKRLATFSLETAVRFSSPPAHAAFMEHLSNTIAELVAQHHDEGSDSGRRFRLTVGSHPALGAANSSESNVSTPEHTND